MSIDLNALARTSAPRPPVVYLYGVGGIGKTTFASFAPDPVFLMTEDGLMSPHLNKCKYLARDGQRLVQSFDEMNYWLDALASTDHGYKSVVVDSLDAFEPLVWRETCERHGWKSIESPGFGKGYVEAEQLWREFLSRIMRLRNERDMCCIMIGHNNVNQVQMPDAEPYNQYAPAMHKRAAKLVYNESDCVLFAMRPVTVITDEGKFSSAKNQQVAQRRAKSDDNVRLYTQERGGWQAKNRYDMPSWIPFDFNIFASYVPFLAAQLPQPAPAEQIESDEVA